MTKTVPRCVMRDYEFEMELCKQCCMLFRNKVKCHWLDGIDTEALFDTEYIIKKFKKRREAMFVVKDVKGKLTLIPGELNRDKFEETEALKKFNIKPQDVEEVYIIYDAFKPEVETKTILKRLDIEGEKLPVQKLIDRAREGSSRKRRTREQIEADKRAAEQQQEG